MDFQGNSTLTLNCSVMCRLEKILYRMFHFQFSKYLINFKVLRIFLIRCCRLESSWGGPGTGWALQLQGAALQHCSNTPPSPRWREDHWAHEVTEVRWSGGGEAAVIGRLRPRSGSRAAVGPRPAPPGWGRPASHQSSDPRRHQHNLNWFENHYNFRARAPRHLDALWWTSLLMFKYNFLPAFNTVHSFRI